MEKKLFYTVIPGIMLAAIFGVLLPAQAVDLSLSYNGGASDEPADDPDGSLLMGLANFAAAEWEDLIGHDYSLPVSVWYEDLGGPLAIMTS